MTPTRSGLLCRSSQPRSSCTASTTAGAKPLHQTLFLASVLDPLLHERQPDDTREQPRQRDGTWAPTMNPDSTVAGIAPITVVLEADLSATNELRGLRASSAKKSCPGCVDTNELRAQQYPGATFGGKTCGERYASHVGLFFIVPHSRPTPRLLEDVLVQALRRDLHYPKILRTRTISSSTMFSANRSCARACATCPTRPSTTAWASWKRFSSCASL
jgi:hypothetical protein